MFRRNNRSFSSVARNSNRYCRKAVQRANQSDQRWLKMQFARRSRMQRLESAYRKAFSFVPMLRDGLSVMWASLASIFQSMFAPAPTRPIRVAMNRDGMLGSNAKRSRGKRRHNARSKSKLESGNTYEAMEPRQLLAADFGVQLQDTGPDVQLLGVDRTDNLSSSINFNRSANNTANFTLTQASVSVDEGDAATFTLTLDGAGNAAAQAGSTASIDFDLTLSGPTSLNDFDENSDQTVNETNPLYLAIVDAVNNYNSAGGAGTGSLLRSPGDDNSFTATLDAATGTATVTFTGDGLATAPSLAIVLDTFEDDGNQQGTGSLTHLSNFVEPNEQFEVSISNPQFDGVADPTSSNSTTLTTTILDDNTTEVQIDAIRDGQEGVDGSIVEENPVRIDGLFSVTLTNPSQNQIVVTLTDGIGNPLVSNGTAANDPLLGVGNDDYQNTSLSNVIFAPGDQSEIASIDVVDDFVTEGNETVIATLGTATFTVDSTGAIPSSRSVGISNTDNSDVLTIFDDDSSILTVQNGVTVDEDDGTASITVTLDTAVQNGFTVPYTLTNGSAFGGDGTVAPSDDFDNVITGVLTFNGTAGEVQTITVDIFNDAVVENANDGFENFVVGLGAIVPGNNTNVVPPVATVTPNLVDVSSSESVTIVDDDIDITLGVATPSSQNEGNPGSNTTYTFTVTRSGLTSGVTTVDWEITAPGGSAVSAADFDFDGDGTPDVALPSGTVTFADGVTTQTIVISLAEDTTLEPDEDFVLSLLNNSNLTHTPTLATDTPIDDTFGVQLGDDEGAPFVQTATIVDDDSASLTVDDVVVDEDAGTATITVVLNGDVQGGLTAVYQTSNGTAIGGSDYTVTTSPTLTFAGNDGDSATFTVAITNDDVVEDSPNGTESFNVSAVSVTPNDSAIASTDIDITDGATVTINDDDIDITIGAATQGNSQLEGNVIGDITTYTFTVTRFGLTSGVTTVDWAVTAAVGSAVTANDFDFDGDGIPDATLPSGTVTFADGQTSQDIVITLAEDTTVEPEEDFVVTLLGNASLTHTPTSATDSPVDNVYGVQLGDDEGAPFSQTATISNDDAAQVSVIGTSVNEADGTVTVEVQLTGTVQGGFTVDYDTADLSALAGTDYVATDGTLTFNGTDDEIQTFTVTISNDSDVESGELFNVLLSNVDTGTSGVDSADISTTNGSITILNDDIDLTLSVANPTSQTEGDAGDNTTYSFVVTRSGLDAGVTAATYTVSVAPGSAVTGDDFAGGAFPTGTVTFADGIATATFDIELAEDSTVEPNEDFVVTLSAPTHTPADSVNGVPADSIDFIANGQVATIVNDDDAVLTVADVSVFEDSTTNTIQVAVSVDNAVQGGFTVDFSTEDISALVGNSDYVATSGTLNFTGTTGESRIINIDIVGDADVELDEAFSINLSNVVRLDGSSPAQIDISDTGSVTILNDDIDLSLEAALVDVQNEGTGFTNTIFTYEVTRSGFITNSTVDTTVEFAVTGSGANPATADDFVGGAFPTGTVTFGPNDATATITVAVAADSLVEFDESFTLTLNNAASADANLNTLEIISTSATGSILNDDTAEVTVNDVFVQEPDLGSTSQAVFTLSLSQPASEAITVNVTTSDGTATTANNDFVPTTQTVTFPAGQTTATFSVDIIGDNVIELDENFFVTLSEPTFAGDAGNGDTLTGGPGADANTATGVRQVEITDAIGEAIINNDEAAIEFAETSTEEGEDGSVSSPLQFAVANGVPTLIVSGDLTRISDVERTVVVQFLSGNSTAVRGQDFTLGNNPFTPASFTIPELNYASIADGGIGTGVFDLTIVNSQGEVATGVGTDQPILTIINDSLIEGPESLELEIQQLTTVIDVGDADGDTDKVADTTHIIIDNDTATISVVPNQTVNENNSPGSQAQSFNVILTTSDGAGGSATLAPGFNIDVDVVDLLGANGGDAAANDFTFTTDTISFSAGQGATPEIRTVEITTNDDSIIEADELVDIGFGNLTTTPSPLVQSQINLVDGTVTILDDELGQTVTIAATTNGSEQGTDGQFTVTLSNASSTDTVIDYVIAGTADAGSDYNALSGTVTILAGQTSATIDVEVLDDNLIEPTETVEVSLTAIASGNTDIFVGSADTATVNIADNELNQTVSIAAAVDGSESGTDGQFTVTLSNPSSTDTVINYSVGGTAIAGTDFTPLNFSVTILAGQTTATIDVAVLDDSIIENTETVEVTLTGITSGDTDIGIAATPNNTAVINLADNEFNQTVSIAATGDGSESGTDGQFTVTLSNPSSTDTVITYNIAGTADAGNDFTALTGSVTILAGQTTANIDVAVLDDSIIEATESVVVTLTSITSSDSDISIGSVDTATVNIADNEINQTVTIAATTNGSEFPSGSAVSNGLFTVTQSNVSSTDTVISYTIAGSATAGSDFAALSGNVTILAGDTTATIDITVLEDSIIEATEFVEINLTAITSGDTDISVGSTNKATIFIADDERNQSVTIAATDGSEGGADGQFTVTLSNPSSTDTVISYNVAGTATAGNDFTALGNTVTILAGQTTATIDVEVFDDSIVENNETVVVTLNSIASGDADISVGAANSATVNIADNDSAVVTLTPIVSQASEQPNAAGVTNGEFLLELSNPSSTPTVINFAATADSNPVLGAIRSGFETSTAAHLQGDYRILVNGVEVTGNTLTIAAGSTSAAITIEVIDDVVVETIENFDLELTGINSADPNVTIAANQIHNVTITDDDQAEVIVKATDPFAIEPGEDADEIGTFTVFLIVPGSVSDANPFGIPAPVSYDIEVSFQISGTANQDPNNPNSAIDFDSIVTQALFAPGITSDEINVTPEEDFMVEPDETVILTLIQNTVDSVILDNLFDTNVTEVFVTDSDCHEATVVIQDNDFATPPEVAGIFLNSTFWTSEFRDQVDGSTSNEATFGYELTPANILQNIPWVNVNEIVVQFDSAIDAASLDALDFTLTGTPGSKFDPGQTDGSIPTVVSATLDPSNPSAVRLTLSHFLEPAAIDINVLGSGLSSNGSPGADSSLQFRSLPGDVDSSNRVLFGGDATSIIPQNGAQLGNANYNFRADVDGSGRILFADATQVLARSGDFLSSPSAFLAASFSANINSDAQPGELNRKSISLEPVTNPKLSGEIETVSNKLQNVDDTFADLFGQQESDSATIDAVAVASNPIEIDSLKF